MDNDWLKQLKPGDRVVMRGNFGVSMRTVDRISPTGRITLDTGHVFDSKGNLRGAGLWDRTYLEPFTPEVAADALRQIESLITLPEELRP